MKIKGSEKRKISRGSINLNPYNPKKHSDDAIKRQARNIRENGYLGGIVYNEITHNLIDGHRRVMALDLINKYDGTNDYELWVEVVHFDEKTELEQLTYMATGNTKADLSMVQSYIDKIDTKWFNDDELKYIDELRESTEMAQMEDLTDLFIKPKEKQGFKAGNIDAAKKKIADDMDERQFALRRHILIRINTDEELEQFCEYLGKRPEYDMIIDADELLKMIE